MRAFLDCPTALRPALASFDFLSPCLVVGETGGGTSYLVNQLKQRYRVQRIWEIDCSGPLGPARRQLLAQDSNSFDRGALVVLENLCASDLQFQSELLQWLYRSRLGSHVIASAKTRIFPLLRNGDFDLRLYKFLARPLLRIPPLCERPAEVIALAQGILAKFLENSTAKGGSLEIGQAAARSLFKYSWPGELSELRVVIERAALHAFSQRRIVIEPSDLLFERVADAAIPHDSPTRAASLPAKERLRPLREVVREYERDYIRQALASGATLTETCKQLEVGRTTMWRKLSHLMQESKTSEGS